MGICVCVRDRLGGVIGNGMKMMKMIMRMKMMKMIMMIMAMLMMMIVDQ